MWRRAVETIAVCALPFLGAVIGIAGYRAYGSPLIAVLVGGIAALAVYTLLGVFIVATTPRG